MTTRTGGSYVDNVDATAPSSRIRALPGPVLDVGCGRRGVDGWIGLDRDAAVRPAVVGDAVALPVRTGSCGAVVAARCLYFLDEPERAVAEAHRALRTGGMFVATTTSRGDSPELVPWLDPPEPSTFDAEEAAEVVSSAFGAVEVESWRGRDVLDSDAALTRYLVDRGVSPSSASEIAAEATVPMRVTRLGVTVRATR